MEDLSATSLELKSRIAQVYLKMKVKAYMAVLGLHWRVRLTGRPWWSVESILSEPPSNYPLPEVAAVASNVRAVRQPLFKPVHDGVSVRQAGIGLVHQLLFLPLISLTGTGQGNLEAFSESPQQLSCS